MGPASTCGTADAALIGCWPLNGDALDYSGSGNNGTWHGSAGGSNGYYSAGYKQSWAGFFNGSTNYITPSGAYLFGLNTSGPTAATITFWAKGSVSPVCDERTGSGIGQGQINLNTNGSLEYLLNANSGPPYNYTLTSSATSNVSNWNFYAVTVSLPQASGNGSFSGTVGLAVNSQFQSGALAYTINGAPATNYSGLGIGRFHNYSYGGDTYFTGLMENVRFYNTVLSQAQLLSLYHQGNP